MVSYLSNVLKNSASRMIRYRQYDSMDYGDLSRGLDIIAEEVAAKDDNTKLPLQLEYLLETNQNASDTQTTTMRAALRHWCEIHDLSNRIFRIARTMCKYGDCFYRKHNDTKQWEYLDQSRVVGIEFDTKTRNIVNYLVRCSNFQQALPVGSGNTLSTNPSADIEKIPAEYIIHFSLSDEEGGSALFGISVLQAAFKDFQKLTMLEDAVLIHRLSRASAKRVYYVDVGNMPAPRVKQFMDTMKNEIRQKRVPNSGNKDQTDGTFNPEAIQEDIFIPVTGTGRGSRVEQLAGDATWEVPELDFFQNRVIRALRIPTSYMRGQESASPGSNFNDGKVGVAYMEERIFSNFVTRIQSRIDAKLDEQFKNYLLRVGIAIDPSLFKLKLVEPQNFALYRQTALDNDIITSFNAINEVPYLSGRFKLSRYLRLTKDEILMNEAMWREEHGIKDEGPSAIRQMYDPDGSKDLDGGGGDDGAGGGDDLGGGDEPPPPSPSPKPAPKTAAPPAPPETK